jgi:hypothetical protein
MPDPAETPQHNPYDIYQPNSPFNPSFMREAVRTLFRSLPIDKAEPKAWADRRMHAALLGLSAFFPRDEIEVMLGVQALCAYHAAAASFRIGMNLHKPNGNSPSHLNAGCSAARTFASTLAALERRQAKPLTRPIGRPDPRTWEDAPHPSKIVADLEKQVKSADDEPPPPGAENDPVPAWTDEDLAVAEETLEQDRIDQENEGLDIANTEGILPGGGMIMPEEPTPQQEAYLARRLALMYKREIEENLKKGITKYPKIRGIRPGDLIP